MMVIPLLLCFGLAQGPPDHGGGPPPEWDHGSHDHPPGRPPAGLPPGRWWRDGSMSRRLGLSADQQKRMDEVFEQSRSKLIDLRATVQKEQGTLDPLLSAEHVDEARAIAEIDRVANARADLEKANARMLLGFRSVLTQEQWRALQSGDGGPPPR